MGLGVIAYDEIEKHKGLFIPHGADNAGFHNSIYRGKNLGTNVTSEQWANIANGTFKDMYIGDYWIINSTTYLIAAFNYYLGTGDTGDTNLTANHITLVPAGDMYTHRMNPTSTTKDGYVGSEMYETGLDQAKTKIHADFPGRVLNHMRYLSNATSDGAASGAAWFDSDIELMNEHMVYGSNIVANSAGSPNAHRYNVGMEKSQLPLFRLRHDLIIVGDTWWLRDVASESDFARVTTRGVATSTFAVNPPAVRPVFSIS